MLKIKAYIKYAYNSRYIKLDEILAQALFILNYFESKFLHRQQENFTNNNGFVLRQCGQCHLLPEDKAIIIW